MIRYQFPMLIPAILVSLAERFYFMIGRFKFLFLSAIWGIKAGKGCMFSGPTIIRNTSHSKIVMGSRVCFIARVAQSMVGITNPTILDTRWGGVIKIGSTCGFSSIVMSSKESITIGDRVECGANVRIFDHDFHSLSCKDRWTINDVKNTRSSPIRIGNDVFIGFNATILKGTTIGDRSIVAAGSVLYGLNVPPDSMVKGNPAIVVGTAKK